MPSSRMVSEEHRCPQRERSSTGPDHQCDSKHGPNEHRSPAVAVPDHPPEGADDSSADSHASDYDTGQKRQLTRVADMELFVQVESHIWHREAETDLNREHRRSDGREVGPPTELRTQRDVQGLCGGPGLFSSALTVFVLELLRCEFGSSRPGDFTGMPALGACLPALALGSTGIA